MRKEERSGNMGMLVVCLAVLSLSFLEDAKAAGLEPAFERSVEAGIADIAESARNLRERSKGRPVKRAPAEAFEAPAIRAAEPTHEETEIARCPAGAEPVSGIPDPDLFTYVGFRFVRDDGSTCESLPGGGMLFLEPQARELSFSGSQASFDYELSAPEFMTRRNFFFRTLLDGTRRFYFHEASRRTGRDIPETVGITFPDRDQNPILPWEGPERFRLEYGRRSGAALVPAATAYEYRIASRAGPTEGGTSRTEIIVETARKKERTAPDHSAVAMTLVKEGSRLLLRFQDRWADYYRGEKLGVRVKLWRNVRLFDDKVAYEMDLELDAAGESEIEPADPRWDSFRKEKIEPGREYYADWSFRRADSRISSGEWVEKGRSNRIKL